MLTLLVLGAFLALAKGDCVNLSGCPTGQICPPKPLDAYTRGKLAQTCNAVMKSDKFCCDASQALNLVGTMDILGEFLRGCPSCYSNVIEYFCGITCSPQQDKYMKNAGTSSWALSVNNQFINGLFDSCKDMRVGGMSILDLVCLEQPDCTPTTFLYQIASKYMSSYNVTIDTNNGQFNEATTPCQSTPPLFNGHCSCQDCPKACQ